MAGWNNLWSPAWYKKGYSRRDFRENHIQDIKKNIHTEPLWERIFLVFFISTNSAARRRFGWTEGISEELQQGCPGYSETVYSLIRRTMVNTKNNPDARELKWQLGFYGIFNRVLAIIHYFFSVNMLLLQVIAHGWSMKNAIGNVLIYKHIRIRKL